MVKNGWEKKTSNSTKNIKDYQHDASNIQGIIETIQNSLFDITNEIAKVQPRYAQSASNFQAEYPEATRILIQTFANFQSNFIKFSWNNFDSRSFFYTDQIRNQVIC